MTLSSLLRASRALSLASLVIATVMLWASPALAQEDPAATQGDPDKCIERRTPEQLNFVNKEVEWLFRYFLVDDCKNYILGDAKALKETVTIVSHKPVSSAAAWEAFMSALQVTGYSVVKSGSYYKIIKSSDAPSWPVAVRSGDNIPATDRVVTQVLPLENVSVGDIQSVVNALKSKNGNIIAYQPTNTLIITDNGYQIRKIYQVINELDVASPKSALHVIRLQYAEASEVQSIIEQLYGVGDASATANNNDNNNSRRRRRRRRRNNDDDAAASAGTASVTAGKESKYIDKIMADQRTNSLIVLANDEGIAAVRGIVAELDVDFTANARSQIHVVRLEQAKAQDVVDVLSRLSQGGGSSGSGRGTSRSSRSNTNTRNNRGPNVRGSSGATGGGDGETSGAIAAFDSGMRIAHDEATNSLVIIASPEDFRIVKSVIDELDRKRKQVFVDAVILEISSEDSTELGLAAHAPKNPNDESIGFLSSQLGASSLGISQDLLSGVALGVFGDAIEVPTTEGTLSIPAFGVVLQAIKTYSGVEIVSNPNLLTLDNAEAKIVVGRKIPFPTNTSFNNLGQPIVTFSREDVAVSMELTPRINSENFVTLEVRVEVSEVEEDDSGLDPLLSGGPVTSKREVETTALVRDNQTVVLGGLVGTTETEVETKVPVLGDVPLIGALFRGKRQSSRKSNLLIFLTPHIVEDDEDMLEIMEVKEAQFREFRRRFYGKSREAAFEEIKNLLQYSMNLVDREPMYRGSSSASNVPRGDGPIDEDSAEAIRLELDRSGTIDEPGDDLEDAPEDLAVPEGSDTTPTPEEE